jgi:hypothetical protein
VDSAGAEDGQHAEGDERQRSDAAGEADRSLILVPLAVEEQCDRRFSGYGSSPGTTWLAPTSSEATNEDGCGGC